MRLLRPSARAASNIASELRASDSLLVAGDKPDRDEPLAQRQLCILEDRSNLDREPLTALAALVRFVGVTQKTAWFMTHRLREAAKTKSFNRPLSGEVEIDETFVGGRERNKHEWKRQHAGTGGTGKTAVFGMLERGGDIRAMKVDDLTAKTVQGKVVEHVEPGLQHHER